MNYDIRIYPTFKFSPNMHNLAKFLKLKHFITAQLKLKIRTGSINLFSSLFFDDCCECKESSWPCSARVMCVKYYRNAKTKMDVWLIPDFTVQ